MIAILDPLDFVIYFIAYGCFVAFVVQAVRIVLSMVRAFRARKDEAQPRVRPYVAVRRER